MDVTHNIFIWCIYTLVPVAISRYFSIIFVCVVSGRRKNGFANEEVAQSCWNMSIKSHDTQYIISIKRIWLHGRLYMCDSIFL